MAGDVGEVENDVAIFPASDPQAFLQERNRVTTTDRDEFTVHNVHALKGGCIGVWEVPTPFPEGRAKSKPAVGTEEDAGGEPTEARMRTLKARSDAMINSIPPFLLSQ